MPQLVQLQALPSGSVPEAVQTRIGWLAPHELPPVYSAEQLDEPVPPYCRSSFVQ
jgi:hypothetical protein